MKIFNAIIKFLFHTHKYPKPTTEMMTPMGTPMLWERRCECGDIEKALFDANHNCIGIKHNGGMWNR